MVRELPTLPTFHSFSFFSFSFFSCLTDQRQEKKHWGRTVQLAKLPWWRAKTKVSVNLGGLIHPLLLPLPLPILLWLHLQLSFWVASAIVLSNSPNTMLDGVKKKQEEKCKVGSKCMSDTSNQKTCVCVCEAEAEVLTPLHCNLSLALFSFSRFLPI